MDINFNNIKELYDRVTPALKSKVKELKRNKINYVKEVDIWNYLIENKWKKKQGLTLADIVDDILNTENNLIDEYVKEKLKSIKRKANMDIEII